MCALSVVGWERSLLVILVHSLEYNMVLSLNGLLEHFPQYSSQALGRLEMTVFHTQPKHIANLESIIKNSHDEIVDKFKLLQTITNYYKLLQTIRYYNKQTYDMAYSY